MWTESHEINLHLKNIIKGKIHTIADTKKEHQIGFGGDKKYYRISSPAPEDIPKNSPQGKRNKRISNAVEKIYKK